MTRKQMIPLIHSLNPTELKDHTVGYKKIIEDAKTNSNYFLFYWDKENLSDIKLFLSIVTHKTFKHLYHG